MDELFTAGSLVAFLTLTALEIVLGIDNVVFIAILTGRLPPHRQGTARFVGLSLAAFGRAILLLGITWVISLEKHVLFSAFGNGVTIKDLVLILGGAFLLGKATWEIHHSLEADPHTNATGQAAAFGAAIAQILLLDLVFSIDSVLTAVGMVDPGQYSAKWVPLTIMISAVVVAIAVMLLFAGPLGRFIQKHPTMKMLALSFLLMIGIVLIAEGLHQHIPRGYIYFAMGFSLFVELLNLKITGRARREGVRA